MNRIVQVIPKAWHCDGDVDCEDGTDEVKCTCVDYLKNENESLICDGIIHCYDASDERHCLGKAYTVLGSKFHVTLTAKRKIDNFSRTL